MMRAGTFLQRCLLSAVLGLVLPASAPPELDPDVDAFFTSITRPGVDESLPPQARASIFCNRIASESLDLESFVTMAAVRVAMSPLQQAAYRQATRQWVVRECIARNRRHTEERLVFGGVRIGADGDRLLATRTTGSSRLIVWRLRGSAPLRAVDLIVDGSSAAWALRRETTETLRRVHGDIDAMIARLGSGTAP